jgi:hypothetical protein
MIWVAVGRPMTPEVVSLTLPPIIALGISTAFSRVSLFAGVKFLGSLQTAILALTEIGVALALAFVVLDDRLSPPQVIGVALLTASILLIRPKDILPHGINPTRIVSNFADMQFQLIAFHRAFGKKEHDNEEATMSTLTTVEISAIREMMGVNKGPVKPITINRGDSPEQGDSGQSDEASR